MGKDRGGIPQTFITYDDVLPSQLAYIEQVVAKHKDIYEGTLPMKRMNLTQDATFG